MPGIPLVRDNDRFARLSDEPPASIPDGYIAPLDMRTTRELMAERDRWLANTETCACCAGLGRVLKPARLAAATSTSTDA